MELLWYQFIRNDGTVVLVPDHSIALVTQSLDHVRVYLTDGSTYEFTGTVETLFSDIAAQLSTLGVTVHTVQYVEPPP